VNLDQLKAFAAGMIELANVVLGVSLMAPIFGSSPATLSPVIAIGAIIGLVLYVGALDILGGTQERDRM
jgi:hypothetical protein